MRPLLVCQNIKNWIIYFYSPKKFPHVTARQENSFYNGSKEGSQTQEHGVDLAVFDLAAIFSATNKFSFSNKIGEGGFGPVYKVTTSVYYSLSWRFI